MDQLKKLQEQFDQLKGQLDVLLKEKEVLTQDMLPALEARIKSKQNELTIKMSIMQEIFFKQQRQNLDVIIYYNRL